MPLNWNDETVPSEADKTTDILGFKEVDGIEQLIYHPFRFRKYGLDINKSGNYCAIPFCHPVYKPIFPKEDFLSGQGLLTSLCNLAMQINSFENKIPYTQLIMEWYTKNMHPYNIDFIYSELNEAAYDLSKEGKYFEGYFFFDKYKRPLVAIPDDLDYGDAKGNLKEEMRIDNKYIKIIRQKNLQSENFLLHHMTITINYEMHLLTSFQNLP